MRLIIAFFLITLLGSINGCDRETPQASLIQKHPDTDYWVLSLKNLQQVANSYKKIPAQKLGGFNQVTSVIKTRDDLLLVGQRNNQKPSIHIDVLAIALRHAYGVKGYANTSLGVSIDPREEEKDPWTFQNVRVLAMPFNNHMAHRMVKLDYLLKLIGAGLYHQDNLNLPPNSWETASASCETNTVAINARHRFWFYPYTPERPRFHLSKDKSQIDIRIPVKVQVLTEKHISEVKDNHPNPAEDEALNFSSQVSSFLQNRPPGEWAALVQDFKMIEVALLLQKIQPASDFFQYLLFEHELERVNVPRVVPGVLHKVNREHSCQSIDEIMEINNQQPPSFKTQGQVRNYRGGVEARVQIEKNAIKKNGTVQSFPLEEILSMKPALGTFLWKYKQRSPTDTGSLQ